MLNSLGPNCLQRLSADNPSKQKVKVDMVFGNVNYHNVICFNFLMHQVPQLDMVIAYSFSKRYFYFTI